jgi:hypothetical protein
MENYTYSPGLKASPEDADIAKEKTGAWWGTKAMEFLEKGDLHRALHYLNLCLDKEFRNRVLLGSTSSDEGGGATSSTTEEERGKEEGGGRGAGDAGVVPDEDHDDDTLAQEDIGITPTDAVGLFEKRCLLHMKLQRFDEVLHDARRILDMRTDHSLAYKCLLVALCKLNKVREREMIGSSVIYRDRVLQE